MKYIEDLIARPPSRTVLAIISIAFVNAAAFAACLTLPVIELPLDLPAMAQNSFMATMLVSALLILAIFCFGLMFTSMFDPAGTSHRPRPTVTTVKTYFLFLMISQIGLILVWNGALSDLLMLIGVQLGFELLLLINTHGMRKANYD